MEFTDGDWKELEERAFDLKVLFYNMREVRRMFHPALHSDQYHYGDNTLDGNRLLLHYVEKMTVALQEKVQREYEKDHPVDMIEED